MDTRITSLAQLDLTKVFSYKDYLNWTFKERVELIRGYVRLMSPAPSTRHQLISGNLYREISKQLTKKSCKIFYAPFDVRLKRKIKDEKAFLSFTHHGPPHTILDLTQTIISWWRSTSGITLNGIL
jgi:hypothetical protein